MDFTSAYKNFGGNLSTQDYKMPEDFNIFGDLSSGALQATSAMNSAQMGKKNSNSLQDAFASVTKGISSEFKPVTEEEARIAGEEMRKSMKAQGLYDLAQERPKRQQSLWRLDQKNIIKKWQRERFQALDR
ncbi:hypothetical protein EBR03_04340 [bacterium]|nr:hypothetical protein [bacterium]